MKYIECPYDQRINRKCVRRVNSKHMNKGHCNRRQHNRSFDNLKVFNESRGKATEMFKIIVSRVLGRQGDD